MALSLLQISDRNERTRKAHALVQTMRLLTPHARDGRELRQRLWDHLHLLTDGRLDVDGPFAPPDLSVTHLSPSRMGYPSGHGKSSHYGSLVPKAAKMLASMPASEGRTALSTQLASSMKRYAAEYGRLELPDSSVVAALNSYAGTSLLPTETPLGAVAITPHPDSNRRPTGRRPQGGNANNGRKRSRSRRGPKR